MSKRASMTVSVAMATLLGFTAMGTALSGELSLPHPVGVMASASPLLSDGSGDYVEGPPKGALATIRDWSADEPPGGVLSPLTPFSTHTGTIDYVAAGAAMRNQGYGTITVSWTGGLVAAYLVWGFMNDLVLTGGTLNGVPITGTLHESNPSNPCWTSTIHTLVADVTSVVVNGQNVLGGFPSGLTAGDDPWTSGTTLPLMEGASLIVIYDSGGIQQREITLYLAADTSSGGTQSGDLPHLMAESPSSKTTYVVSDGQLPGNEAYWNFALLDGDAFPGADPRATTQFWSFGNLWDTRTYFPTVAPGSVSENVGISGEGPSWTDCLTWHAQVLRVDGLSPPPNEPPTLSWTGASGYSLDGLEPEVGMTFTTFTYRVVYADADNDPPAGMELLIEKPGGSPWGTFPMTLVTWIGAVDDYVAGAMFESAMTLPLGTDYWYSFRASDGREWATGPPTGWIDAPDVIMDNPPMAVARAVPTVAHMGDTVLFDGTGSTDDLGVVAYLWDFGGGSVVGNALASHLYTSRGTFTALLTVWDTAGQPDTDAVTIEIENRPPVADAGPDAPVFKNTLVALDGAGSTDLDGDTLTYSWTQTDGPAIVLSGADTVTPTFTARSSGTYSFVLAVGDGWGGQTSDSVSVVAPNRAPVADAGYDDASLKNVLVTLDGSASYDPDGDPLTFEWNQVGGPHASLSDADATAPSFVPAAVGMYAFELRVNDGDGGTSVDSVMVTVNGLPPVARLAANPIATEVGKPIAFDGSSSSDPDGRIVSFAFAYGDGATTGGAEAVTYHTYGERGTYEITLAVTDDDGDVDSVSVSVEVFSPLAPVIVVDLNWKPLVAAVFATMLLVLGVRSARRKPWRRDGKRDSAVLAFAFASLPFVLAEAGTGILSYVTGYLSIPPLLGLGTAVDASILLAGVLIALLRARRPSDRAALAHPTA